MPWRAPPARRHNRRYMPGGEPKLARALSEIIDPARIPVIREHRYHTPQSPTKNSPAARSSLAPAGPTKKHVRVMTHCTSQAPCVRRRFNHPVSLCPWLRWRPLSAFTAQTLPAWRGAMAQQAVPIRIADLRRKLEVLQNGPDKLHPTCAANATIPDHATFGLPADRFCRRLRACPRERGLAVFAVLVLAIGENNGFPGGEDMDCWRLCPLLFASPSSPPRLRLRACSGPLPIQNWGLAHGTGRLGVTPDNTKKTAGNGEIPEMAGW